MFCFVVARPRTYEEHNVRFMRPQLQKCDAYDVFSNESFPVAHNRLSRAVIQGDVDVQIRGTVLGPIAANVPIFMQVWRWLSMHYTIYNQTWVVKIDADSLVDIPRLRAFLVTCTLRPPVITTHTKSSVWGASFALHSSILKNYSAFRQSCEEDYRMVLRKGGFFAEDHYMFRCLTARTTISQWPIQPVMIEHSGCRTNSSVHRALKIPKRFEECARRITVQQPIYFEHVMKTGGTSLCNVLRAQRGCMQSKNNCRVADYGRLDAHDCNIAANEPGWTGLWTQSHYLRPAFWNEYTTILLVRNPSTRYVSHVRMNGHVPLDHFITRHLVPDFRSCNESAIEMARQTIDKFTIVLNLVDHPALSACICQRLLGITLGHDNIGIGHDNLSIARYTSSCDSQVVAHANRRLIADSALYGCA